MISSAATVRTEPGTQLACEQNPELFFSEGEGSLRNHTDAMALCGTCPARPPCLAGAIERHEPWGVWGGALFLHGQPTYPKPPRGPTRHRRRSHSVMATSLVSLGERNGERQRRAAAQICGQVERALQVLGDSLPEHLLTVARARLAHPELSIRELGQVTSPPLTKHAVFGRLRRIRELMDETGPQAVAS